MSHEIIAYESDGTTVLLDLSGTTGLLITSVTKPGASYRTRTVEFDDVPGETTVSAVKAAVNMVIELAAYAASTSDALTIAETVSDALADPTLRTWYVAISTDSSERVETWRIIRPADVSPVEMDAAVGQGVATFSVTLRCHPTPTVTTTPMGS